MKFLCKLGLAPALVTGVALWLGPASARANLSLTLTDVGTGDTVTLTDSAASPGLIVFAPTDGFGNFASLQLIVRSNYDGGQSLPPQDSGGLLQDIQIDTRNTSDGTDTIQLAVTATPFTGPDGSPLLLTNSLASSLNPGTADFTSTLTSGPYSTTTSTVTLPLGMIGAPESSALAPRSGTYTLSNVMNVTLDAETSGQYTGTTQALAVIPEPGTMIMAFSALPLVGLGLWRRRRARA